MFSNSPELTENTWNTVDALLTYFGSKAESGKSFMLAFVDGVIR